MTAVDTADVTWNDSLRRLAKQLALTVPRALLICWLLIGLSFVFNQIFAVVFLAVSGLGGHAGMGAAIFLPVAELLFLPWTLATAAWAHAQAVRRVTAGAVASQSEPLARVAAHLLAQFLAGRGPDAGAADGGRVDRAWRRYLSAQRAVPAPVRFLLARLWGGQALAASIAAAAERGVAGGALAQALAADAIRGLAARNLGPKPKVARALLGANLLWFALVMYAVSRAVSAPP